MFYLLPKKTTLLKRIKISLVAFAVIYGVTVTSDYLTEESSEACPVTAVVNNKEMRLEKSKVQTACFKIIIWDGCRKKGERWIWHWFKKK